MSVEFDISEFKELIEKVNNITFGYFTFVTIILAIAFLFIFVLLLFYLSFRDSIDKFREAIDAQLRDKKLRITYMNEKNEKIKKLNNELKKYKDAFKKLQTCYDKYVKKNKNKFGESEIGEENEKSENVFLTMFFLFIFVLVTLITFIFMVKSLKLISEIRTIQIDENNINIALLNQLMDKQNECTKLTRNISIFSLVVIVIIVPFKYFYDRRNERVFEFGSNKIQDTLSFYSGFIFITFGISLYLFSEIISKSNGVLKKIKYYHDNEQNIKFV